MASQSEVTDGIHVFRVLFPPTPSPTQPQEALGGNGGWGVPVGNVSVRHSAQG